MANVDVAEFEFSCNTTNGNQTIASGLGFTPKAYIIWSTLNTSDATYQEDSNVVIGFSDGTTTASLNHSSNDNAGISATAHAVNDDFKIVINGTITIEGQATHSSFGSGTIVINWSNAPSSAFKFYGIAFGGDTFSAELKKFTTGRSTIGNQSYTTTMSSPQCGFFLGSTDNTVNTSTASTHAVVSLGIAISTSKRATIALCAENGGNNMDTWRLLDNTKCLSALIQSSGTINYVADFVSWDANGFTLNYTDAPTASDLIFYAMVMNGANFDMGTLAKLTSTGDSVVSPNIDTIKGILMFSNNAQVSTSNASHSRFSLGGASSTTTEGGCWTGDTDAVGTAVAVARSDDSNILVMATENATPASSTTEAIANISAISSGSFTLTYTTCTTLAADIIWWTIGEGTPAVAEAEEAIQSYGNIIQMFDSNKNAIFG